jgi:phage protein D
MRQPRGLVKVNGEVLQGWTSWEVKNTGIYTADTFRVELSLTAQPLNRPWSWWEQQQQLQIEIFAGFPADPVNFSSDDLTSFILGNADISDTDPFRRRMTLTGRDLTAAMIDAKSDQKYPNLTSSQIVTRLASQYGLTPNVTATKTKVGVYYDIDHVVVTAERSIWDLLSYLAQREGFQVGVTGNTLNFGPRPTDTQPYVIQWQEPQPIPSANVTDIRFSRNLTLARDVVVKVRSWNMAQKAAYTKTATIKHAAGSPGQPQVYSYVIPGLTPDQCQQKAQSLAHSISQHEAKFSADLPGDIEPLTSDTLEVQGTGTVYDQIYYPSTITRSMRMPTAPGDEGGFRMSIDAKNVLPSSVELI